MHNTATVWTPHVTVAAIIEREINGQKRYLMVREHTRHGIRLNQPAGHWEAGETLIQGIQREVLEESGYEFTPEALLGIYISEREDQQVTYLRFTYVGQVGAEPVRTELDEGIIAAQWLTYDEIMANECIHRNKIVAQCLRDYCLGQRIDHHLINDLRAEHALKAQAIQAEQVTVSSTQTAVHSAKSAEQMA